MSAEYFVQQPLREFRNTTSIDKIIVAGTIKNYHIQRIVIEIFQAS